MENLPSKKEIRKLYKEKRKNMSLSESTCQSGMILENFFDMDEYKISANILTYVSHDNEVDTISLISRALCDNKNVAVPRVYGDIMHFHKINSLSELNAGAFGILEPETGDFYEPAEGIIIVPGIAFDKMGHRVGYGGGYYDKFLEKNNGLLSIAFAYDFQVTDYIAYEEYDKKPDILITPEKIIRINQTGEK